MASATLPRVNVIGLGKLGAPLAAVLASRGFQVIGLDSSGDSDLAELPLKAPLALVLGAEGKGLRQLTKETCDYVARLALPGAIQSLNVSNAAALSLYIAATRLKSD